MNTAMPSRSLAAGAAHLAVALVDGASAVIAAGARQPCSLVTVRPRGACAWVYATSYGGGLLAGDALDLHVDVGDGARLLLATQASTKIYRSDDGRIATQSFAVTVGDGAVLLHLPEPVTPFAGSRFRQDQRIACPPGAGLCWIDGVTAGRAARDERWLMSAFRSRLELRCDGMLRFLDTTDLTAGRRPAAQRLHPWGAFATVLVGGPPLAPLATTLLDRIASRPVERDVPLLIAASPIPGWGVVLRLAAIAQESIDRELRRLLAPLTAIAGDDPWQRRP